MGAMIGRRSLREVLGAGVRTKGVTVGWKICKAMFEFEFEELVTHLKKSKG